MPDHLGNETLAERKARLAAEPPAPETKPAKKAAKKPAAQKSD